MSMRVFSGRTLNFHQGLSAQQVLQHLPQLGHNTSLAGARIARWQASHEKALDTFQITLITRRTSTIAPSRSAPLDCMIGMFESSNTGRGGIGSPDLHSTPSRKLDIARPDQRLSCPLLFGDCLRQLDESVHEIVPGCSYRL